MMLIDCWLLMKIIVYLLVSEINIMIFVWVLTRLKFKFKRMMFWNFWCTSHGLIQQVNIEWNLNSDADYTGNIVDRKIISVTWLIFETFICCIVFFFSKENIYIFFTWNNFQIANIFIKPLQENYFCWLVSD